MQPRQFNDVVTQYTLFVCDYFTLNSNASLMACQCILSRWAIYSAICNFHQIETQTEHSVFSLEA